MKPEMMGCQWHQLDHMQFLCTSLQTDSHAGTSSLDFFTGWKLLQWLQCFDTVGLAAGRASGLWKSMGGWWRWALVSLDGVASSRMVSVSASVNLSLHHKVQKFSSGTGSPGWSRKNGLKTVVVWMEAVTANRIKAPKVKVLMYQ